MVRRRRSNRWTMIVSCATIGVVGVGTMAVAQDLDVRARTVTLAPGGSDDTERLQAAFDLCVSAGSGCTVRLGAGTFYVGQIVTRGFDGVLAGAGHDVTVIEIVAVLQEPVARAAMTSTTEVRGAPRTITFVDSNVMIAALSVRVPVIHLYGGRSAVAAPPSAAAAPRAGGGDARCSTREVRLDDGMNPAGCG